MRKYQVKQFNTNEFLNKIKEALVKRTRTTAMKDTNKIIWCTKTAASKM